MQIFKMPAEVDPEPGVPDEIRHGCDYMTKSDGSLEFYYNFLEYFWRVNGTRIAARCYLDEADTINFSVAQAVLDTSDTAPVLAFAQRRFRKIATLETAGYETHWTLGDGNIRNR